MKKSNFIFLSIITLLVFGNTLSNGYNLDDHLVTNNHALTNSETDANLVKIFSSPYQNQGGMNYGFRPVTIASFYLEHQFFGESVVISHSINLILYLAIVLAVLYLLGLICTNTNPYILFFIALLFCVHSVHSEVAASIKNRDELLCVFFFLIATLSAFKWVSIKNAFYLGLIFLFITLSVLSKKSALPVISLIPVLVFYTNKISASQFLKIGLAVSIPTGLFAFNLQLLPGLATFFALNIFYLAVFYIPAYWVKWEMGKLTFHEVLALFVFFLCSIVGIYFKQLALIVAAELFLLVLIKNHFRIALLLSASLSIFGYFFLFKTELLIYVIILLSAGAFVSKQTFKFNPKVLIVLIPLVALLSYEKQDFNEILIQLSPLLIFSTILVRRFMPLIISLITVLIGLYFNFLGYFQAGLLLFSVLALLKIDMNHFKKFYLLGWLAIVFLFMGFTFSKQGEQYIFNANVHSLGQQVDQEELQEGRKLEFVENTLVVQHTLEERVSTSLVVMGTYLELMIFPRELSFYYGYSKINTTNFKDYKVWISLFGYLLLLYCAIYFFKKQPLISIGSIWFISCTLLFSNLPVLVAGMVGERLAFSASLGFCIMIGGVLNWIKPQFSYEKIRGLEVLSIVLLLAFSLRTFARNGKWESTTVLMSNDIKHLENSAQANYLLGVHSIKKTLKNYKGSKSDIHEIQQSIKHFKRAVEIEPKHYEFHLSLAKAYLSLDENELAMRSFKKSYELAPKALISLFELAKINFMLKDYKQAINYSRLYIEQSTSNPLIYELAAFGAYYLDDYELSISYAKEGLNQFPQNEKLNELFFDLQRRMP